MGKEENRKHSRPLTEQEKAAAVEAIRRKYDDYIVTFFKPPSARQAFENRYFEVLKAKVDLTSFIAAEMGVIDELFRREREKENDWINSEFSKASKKAQPSGSLTDRVAEKIFSKIEKYPEMDFHPAAAYEMRKLFGGLKALSKNWWPHIDRILRREYPAFFASARLDLESALFRFCGFNESDIPQILNKYISQLNGYPRNTRLVEKDAQDCMRETAFFLHTLLSELDKLLKLTALNEKDKACMTEARQYINSLIDDFRVKELRSSKN